MEKGEDLHLKKKEFNTPNPMTLCAKFGWNWQSGSGEDENVKKLQMDRQTDGWWTIGDQNSSLELSAQVS